jgi:hypothetical protein
MRLREFVWVGGGVTAPVAWASGPSALASRGPWGRRCRGTHGPARSREWPWGQRSVHRSAKTAPRSCFGAFVYTVAPLRTDVGTQKCTQIGENGPSAPFWAICVHCCDARCDASCDARSGKVPCTASLCRPETFSIPDEWEASHGRQFEKLYSQTSLPDSLQSIDASVELAHRLLGPVLAGLAGGVTWSLHETAWEDQICYGKRRRIPRIRPRPAAGRPCNRPS